ncbi:GH12 family glycosyl hydrolase domain-containing protein [Fodinicola feengrottensis]|uniref:GH12 family glycosyl hydrolase domain-containing protein n=1 Tax=Fodinicola feengrottensis TaxID=435914 RepID=UPI0013D17BEA|nr:hypothetical protein [Fodinicola feengrottensis]
MTLRNRFVTLAALVSIGLGALSTPAVAATTLCHSQTASVAGGTYIVQNDEWNSSANECISTSGGADFAVVNSSMNSPTGQPPAGYPSIYKGCHWGACTPNSGFPIQVSALSAGKVTTSWSTSQPAGSNVYDVAYDVWYNQSASTSGQPNGTEVMIWFGAQRKRWPGRFEGRDSDSWGSAVRRLVRAAVGVESRFVRANQPDDLGERHRRS